MQPDIHKTEEIVSKFKNGEKRFMESALFNRCVQMLVRDVDPLVIIEQLIDVTEDTQRAFQIHLMKYPQPII